MYELTILGSSAAMPAYQRHPTSQLFALPHTRFLIDCGEGTQMQMQRYRVKPNRIKHIVVSHLHGDHYLGLVGLLSSMHLQKRQQPLNLFAPRELAEIIQVNLRYSGTYLSYKVNFHPLPKDSTEIFFEDEQVTVQTIPMNHRIQCNGFLFKEKIKKKKVLAEKLPEGTPWKLMNVLKNGENVLDDEGNILYKWEDYTIQPKSYSFAHCSDTKYNEAILPQIEGVDLLYHESTFLHKDLDKAEQTFHTTAQQAATLAHKAGVGKLLIGHFSSRYKNLKPFLEEARSVFPNTYLGIEGETTSIYQTQNKEETDCKGEE